MAEAAVVKSNTGSNKRKAEYAGGYKSKKSMTSTSGTKNSESFEDSVLNLLMSNDPANTFNVNEGNAISPTEGKGGLIKRTFHLGGDKICYIPWT